MEENNEKVGLSADLVTNPQYSCGSVSFDKSFHPTLCMTHVSICILCCIYKRCLFCKADFGSHMKLINILY